MPPPGGIAFLDPAEMEDVTLAIGVASALVAGGVVAYLLTRSAPPGRKLNPFSAKMAEGCFVKKTGAPTGAISAALDFSELPSPAEMQALLRDKLLSFDAFTSVFRSGCWVPVEVDLAAHVFEATVGSEAELLAYCEKGMVAPLRNGADALTMHQAVVKQKKSRHASHRRAAPSEYRE